MSDSASFHNRHLISTPPSPAPTAPSHYSSTPPRTIHSRRAAAALPSRPLDRDWDDALRQVSPVRKIRRNTARRKLSERPNRLPLLEDQRHLPRSPTVFSPPSPPPFIRPVGNFTPLRKKKAKKNNLPSPVPSTPATPALPSLSPEGIDGVLPFDGTRDATTPQLVDIADPEAEDSITVNLPPTSICSSAIHDGASDTSTGELIPAIPPAALWPDLPRGHEQRHIDIKMPQCDVEVVAHMNHGATREVQAVSFAHRTTAADATARQPHYRPQELRTDGASTFPRTSEDPRGMERISRRRHEHRLHRWRCRNKSS